MEGSGAPVLPPGHDGPQAAAGFIRSVCPDACGILSGWLSVESCLLRCICGCVEYPSNDVLVRGNSVCQAVGVDGSQPAKSSTRSWTAVAAGAQGPCPGEGQALGQGLNPCQGQILRHGQVQEQGAGPESGPGATSQAYSPGSACCPPAARPWRGCHRHAGDQGMTRAGCKPAWGLTLQCGGWGRQEGATGAGDVGDLHPQTSLFHIRSLDLSCRLRPSTLPVVQHLEGWPVGWPALRPAW